MHSIYVCRPTSMAQPVRRLRVVPAEQKHVEAQFVEMKVPLYSFGCEKKVKKALSHLPGIHSVHVDYYRQKVTVWGICSRDDVLATVRKKRREARFWEETPKGEVVAPPPKVEEDDAAPAPAAAAGHRGWKPWKKKKFPLGLY